MKVINIEKNSQSYIKFFYLIFLLILCFIVYYYNTKDLQLKIAYKGWGPQDYVNHKLYPDNFKKDWPNGILVYDNSLPMKTYYYFAKYLHITPTQLMYPYMFLQIFLFAFSVYFLANILFKDKNVALLCAAVALCSPMTGINLANFGYGFQSYLKFPLYYGPANALRILALAFFLKNQYIIAFFMLVLSSYSHLTMGLFVLMFMGGYFVIKPERFFKKDILIGGGIFLVLIVPYIYLIYSHLHQNISSGEIPFEMWLKSTKIFSYHWYPITMKRFTLYAHKEFFPILMVTIFFLLTLKENDLKEEKHQKVIWGCIICAILTGLGVLFSDVCPMPVLIKIALTRASSLISFFATLYTINYLYKHITNGNLYFKILSSYSLLIFIFAHPGITILPLLIVIYYEIRKYRLSIKIFYYTIIISLTIITLLNFLDFYFKVKFIKVFLNFLWTPLLKFNPAREFDFFIRGGIIKTKVPLKYIWIGSLIFSLLIYINTKIKYRLTQLNINLLLIIFILTTIYHLKESEFIKWRSKYGEKAKAYLNIQYWARAHTPKTSLFMYDPSTGYGWRDFSIRSSFGVLHEWGFTSIGYNSNKKIYFEGLKRMKDFGIDITKISFRDIKKYSNGIYYTILQKQIKKVFYRMSPNQFKNLANKYKINYLVMKKQYHHKKFKTLPVVYENKHYVVYQLSN